MMNVVSNELFKCAMIVVVIDDNARVKFIIA